MTVEELARALGQARHISNGQWEATCPAHDDTHASLHITTGNKRPIVFFCRSGCPNPDVVNALKSRGLWWQCDCKRRRTGGRSYATG